MNYILLKRTALIVLITFFSMIVTPYYSYGESKNNDFDEGKEFFKGGDYDKATEFLDRFIEDYSGNESYKTRLSDAFYYKARIYFSVEEYAEMEKALRKLYEINKDYGFIEEKDLDFIKKANEIKSKWEEEKREKERLELEKRNVLEKEGKGKGNGKGKKKFPWLLVAGGVVVAGLVAYLLLKPKPGKKTLTVIAGEGVEGTPASGTYSYKKGQTVNYNFSLKSGYTGLSIKLDGNDAAASGSITMNQDHTLTASTSKRYTLTVVKRQGVNGTPDSGTYFYNESDQVNYNYSLQSGYENLTVTLDGSAASVSGTITMNRDHTLIASSGQTFSLTVQKGTGVSGTPDTGIFTYTAGETVNYNYGLQSGYTNLFVTLDGIQVPASGTITMDRNHILIAAASPAGQYTLTVTKGAGVNGTPDSGTFTYNQGAAVSYNYTFQSGYQNLVVTLDGTPVSASGAVTMDKNHTLNASATTVGQYTLTVTRGTGVNGTPAGGTYTYNEGTAVSYNYTLQDGYKDLVVTLDGTTVNANGTVTMNANHTLIASATLIGNQYTLTVTKGAGVDGTPDSGTYTYNQGTAVNYNYTLQSGYKDLVVTLDGNTISASGTVTMNANHTLSATATPPVGQYTLTVTKGAGVNGTPETGTYNYAAGTNVSYNYTLKNGYKDLVVKLDGSTVSNSGSIPMNSNHTLTVSAAPVGTQYTLTVTKGAGVDGTPNSGTTAYNPGATVNYNYTLQTGYSNLVVTLDGSTVSAGGTITMDKNHTLSAAASVIKTYTLTVTKGTGVNGTPNSGTYTYSEGATVDYNYAVQAGYQNLAVTLDGNPVNTVGTITMNANHTLAAAAVKQWTLTVTVGDGVDGSPEPGTYTFTDGQQIPYSYSLQTGYTDLVVKLDGTTVSDSGTIAMNSDHTLTASATPSAGKNEKK